MYVCPKASCSLQPRLLRTNHVVIAKKIDPSFIRTEKPLIARGSASAVQLPRGHGESKASWKPKSSPTKTRCTNSGIALLYHCRSMLNLLSRTPPRSLVQSSLFLTFSRRIAYSSHMGTALYTSGVYLHASLNTRTECLEEICKKPF